MVDVTPPTPPSPPAPTNKRARGAPPLNELRPSPAIVSWIDRAVQRITADPPWVYQADSPVPSRVEVRRVPGSDLEEKGFGPRASSQPQPAPPATSAPLDTSSVPADVRERFVRMGRYYYFPVGNVAFEDRGKKVVTKSENTEVVRSLVEIAQARGWQDITVSGTERFRREAWRQATYAGLIVRGYQPTEQDKRQFVRDLAKARTPQEPPEPLIDPPPPMAAPYREMPVPAATTTEAERATPQQSQIPFEREADPERERPLTASNRHGVPTHRAEPTPAVSNPAPGDLRSEMRREKRGRSQRSRVYSGRLIEHGEARYKFLDDKELSYFVRLETPNGAQDLWGVDLVRALNQAEVKEGDLIEVELTGRKNVAVKRQTRDGQGRVLGEEEVAAHRNEWNIRGANDRSHSGSHSARNQSLYGPAASGRQAARDNPALTNALTMLRAAELLADVRIPDAAQRTQFIESVRAQLAQVLETDAMPPTPQLRERPAERMRTPARALS